MLTLTPKGLFCAAGGFYIDPSRAVDHAVITHAHSDHARRGSKFYYCASPGVGLLKSRLGDAIVVQGVPYREQIHFGDVTVSFHSAGHILGSAQVRIEFNGEVWVVSGDYKREHDPSCAAFETVHCDVFVTEATFGTPAFSWNKETDFAATIMEWHEHNATQGFNSILYAYSLGKAQRILSTLASVITKPVFCHPATEKLNHCYRNEGVKLADSYDISKLENNTCLQRELILTAPSFFKSEHAACAGKNYKIAFASGWMAGKSDRYDNGFVMSDHADWHDLLRTITESGASRVFVQHRGHGALVRELKKRGLKAHPDSALIPKNPNQLAFF